MISHFVFSDANWNDLMQAAVKDSITLNTLNAKEKESIINQVKAAIARQLWRSEGYFETINATDETVKKAISILDN
jgi:carboxyl-terminal processing protease